MADIVVTIPKSRLAEVEQEEREMAERLAAGEAGWHYYWTLPRWPSAEHGPGIRRCYFAWDGAVRAWHRVIGWQGREGKPAVLLDPIIHELEVPIPMKGFRGFRYFEPPTPPGAALDTEE